MAKTNYTAKILMFKSSYKLRFASSSRPAVYVAFSRKYLYRKQRRDMKRMECLNKKKNCKIFGPKGI